MCRTVSVQLEPERRQLINHTRVLCAAALCRAVYVAAAVEDDSGIGKGTIVPLKGMENVFRPASAGRRQLKNHSTSPRRQATITGSVSSRKGSAINVARPIHREIAEGRIASINAAGKGMHHRFRPGAEHALAGSGRRLQTENNAEARCASIVGCSIEGAIRGNDHTGHGVGTVGTGEFVQRNDRPARAVASHFEYCSASGVETSSAGISPSPGCAIKVSR